jgi:hypothetical protein
MTRILTLFFIGWLVPVALYGQTLTWDASAVDATHSAPTGYTVQWGTASGVYTQTLDAKLATSVPVPTLAPATYFFTVVARGDVGVVSVPSNEVQYVVPSTADHACDYPLGNRTITIFFTPPLLKTGDGGTGTDARISFRVLSPNSPITHIGVMANGSERPGALSGSNLGGVGSIWFQVPALPATYAITATNAYGCVCTQAVQ